MRERNYQQLAHHGFIRIIIKDALQNLRLIIQWEIFSDMPTKEDIKALTYEVSPTVSEKAEEEIEAEEDEVEQDEDDMDEDEDEIDEEEDE